MAKQQLGPAIKTNLKLNSALSQSLKALQLPSIDLEDFIKQQIVENPFLIKESNEEKDQEEIFSNINMNFRQKNVPSNEDHDFLSNLPYEESLKEFLYKQIVMHFSSINHRIIAECLTDYLNDDGYLEDSLENISEILKISTQELEFMLAQLQDLEPPGIFARNLKECLMLQLREKNLLNITMDILLSNLDLVASMDIKKLVKITGSSKEEIISLIQVIKTLEPKPGRNFSMDKVYTKIPDVFIYVNGAGEIIVKSSHDSIPNLKVDQIFYDHIKQKCIKSEEKEYANKMMQSAVNLVKSLEMRGKTIALVASAIAKEQSEFFKRGVLYLRPLTLSKIAEITGYNESTISRATNNKYVGTVYGVLEMKYFFSSEVRSKYSKEGVSSQKVKELIKNIIAQESQESPLSDEEIVKSLQQFNILIARRTVTKYRESINIPSKKDRKRSYH
ncbi:MAG: RNA polymerase factor sigma-54 [Rickettsiaceae bacterium]|nr:RNA polymerase factor sigma-54 [Rickettsiaceae bacterium]